jgi:hypothetical protein
MRNDEKPQTKAISAYESYPLVRRKKSTTERTEATEKSISACAGYKFFYRDPARASATSMGWAVIGQVDCAEPTGVGQIPLTVIRCEPEAERPFARARRKNL